MEKNDKTTYYKLISEIYNDFQLLKKDVENLERKLSYLKASTQSTDVFYNSGFFIRWKYKIKKFVRKFF